MPSWTKMSEIPINTVEKFFKVEQISLLTTCTTRLHRYYRVTLHFLDFHQKIFPEIPPLPFYYPPPFITFARGSVLGDVRLKRFHCILTKLYQIAYFHDPKMKNKSIFKNWNFFGPPTKSSNFSNFSGILLLFSTEISRSGTDIPNHQSSFRT